MYWTQRGVKWWELQQGDSRAEKEKHSHSEYVLRWEQIGLVWIECVVRQGKIGKTEEW